MKKILFTILVCIGLTTAKAQYAFEKTYNFYNNAYGEVLFIQDDGYLLAFAGLKEKYYFSLLKTDFNGDTIWTKNYDIGLVSDYFSYGDMDEYGNMYISCGDGPNNLVKINPQGEILWVKGYHRFKRSIKYYNNALWVATEGAYLYKIDPNNGDSLWCSPRINENQNFQCIPIAMTVMNDGKVLFTVVYSGAFGALSNSTIYSYDDGAESPVKVTLDNNQSAFITDINAVENELWAVGRANYYSTTSGLFFMKFLADGTILSIADSMPSPIRYNRFIINSEGNIVLLGESTLNGDNSIYLHCMTSDYDSIWTRNYNNGSYLSFQVRQTNDNGYIISGSNESISGSINPVLIKTNSEGLIISANSLLYSSNAKVYPNPVSNLLVVESTKSGPGIFSIYNMLGRLVMKTQITGDATTVNVSNLEKGIYLYEIKYNDLLYTGKVIVR